ncbi:MAG TPA: hypothetical protein VH700_00675 [Gemmatimonadales bacterium]
MPRSLAPASAAIALLTFTLTTPAHAKPCSGAASVQELEELFPRATVALGLAGTDEVAIDPNRHCIGVQVRTYGTARLVKLILRSMEVPRQAVELRVVEVKPAGGA